MEDFDMCKDEDNNLSRKKIIKKILSGVAFTSYISLIPIMLFMQDKSLLLIGVVIAGEVAGASSRISSTIKLMSDAACELEKSEKIDNSFNDSDKLLLDNNDYQRCNNVADSYCFAYGKGRPKVRIRRR